MSFQNYSWILQIHTTLCVTATPKLVRTIHDYFWNSQRFVTTSTHKSLITNVLRFGAPFENTPNDLRTNLEAFLNSQLKLSSPGSKNCFFLVYVIAFSQLFDFQKYFWKLETTFNYFQFMLVLSRVSLSHSQMMPINCLLYTSDAADE